jgi:hypothetical protein
MSGFGAHCAVILIRPKAYVEQGLSDLRVESQTFATNAADNAEQNANSYTDTITDAIKATIASQSTATSQNIDTLSSDVTASIDNTKAVLTSAIDNKDAAQTTARNTQAAQLQADITSVDMKANTIRADLTGTQTALAGLTNTVNVNVAADITAANTATSQLRTDLLAIINSKQTDQTNALNAQSATLTTSIGNVDTKANGIRTDLTTTQNSLGGLTNTVNNNISPSLTNTKSDLTNLGNTVTTVSGKVGTLENTVNNNVSPRVGTLEGQNLNSRLGTAESKVTQYGTDIPALQSRATRAELVVNCRLNEMAYSLLRGVCMPNADLWYRKWMVDYRHGSFVPIGVDFMIIISTVQDRLC